MRAFLVQSVTAARPEAGGVWFPGLPHAAAALLIWPVFGAAACVTGLLMAGFVSFVVWLPITAITLNRGEPLVANATTPPLPRIALLILFGLWILTAWAAAAMTR